MINKNGNHSPSQAVVSDTNTNHELLKAIRNTNSRMANLEKEMSAVQGEVSALKQAQILAAAIQNAEYNSFRYFDVSEDSWGDYVEYNTESEKASKYLVRKMLFAFQQGCSFTVGIGSLEAFTGRRNREEMVESAKDYHRELQDKIHELTGVKPSLEWMKDGSCEFHFN